MCHYHGLGQQASEQVSREDVAISLSTGESMPGALFRPTGKTTGSVVLVSDIYGMTDFYLDLGHMLAAEGLSTLVVDYYFRLWKLEENTREAAHARRGELDEVQTLKDVDTAIGWLKDRNESTSVGVVGFCIGGMLAFDLAAERKDLAVVSFYGLVAGIGGVTAAPAPLEIADRISGPILSFWGEQDQVVDIANDVSRFEGLMEEHGVDYEQTIYPGVGHGFLAGLAEDPDEDDPAKNSWRRTLEFLRRELGANG